MKQSGAIRWQRYKTEFLHANHCTEQEFHDAYVAFMQDGPDIIGYRKFAKKYHITIHPDPNISPNMQTVLSVNIAAIKVMARTYAESISAIKDIIKDTTP